MNKRIEAMIYECWVLGPVGYHFDKRLFASKIIEKCVQQCQVVAELSEVANTAEVARKTKATANSCAFFIKEHFK